MGYVKKFKVPAHDEMPSEEMIEWLHGLKQEWDGDDFGINICEGRDSSGDERWILARPGEWLIQDEATGFVTVATPQQIQEMGL